jgi:DNA-binding transcriptional ArsR family regulator
MRDGVFRWRTSPNMSLARPDAKPRSHAGTAHIFAALGDELRLRLVARLCTAGPLSISRLTDGTAVTRQAITKHLNVLADVGIVRGMRNGRERVWELEPRQLEEARRYLDRISTQWDEALGRLQQMIERAPR